MKLHLLAAVCTAALAAASCGSADDDAGASEPADVVDAYFANAGETDAVLSLLTPDATLTRQFQSDPVNEFERGDWEASLAFYAAQGTVLTPHSCTVSDDEPADDATTFSCDYELLDAPTQAVGAPPVPATTRFVVTSLRLSEIHDRFDPAGTGVDFLHIGEPFRRWLAATHPDLTCMAVSELNTPCDNWPGNLASVEEAGALGPMVAQHAQEWAAYLEETGCTYLDGC